MRGEIEMDWYEEDFYNEPSEFEMQIDEFKQSLMQSVKKEFLDKLERLEEENKDLQDIKKNFLSIKNDYEDKERKLEREYQYLKSQVRRERLGEIMKDSEIEMYTVASRSHEKPKCDKCDDERKIHYTTPLGKKTYETCDCAKRTYVYEVISTMLHSFSFRNGEARAWYEVKKDRDDEWLHYHEDSISMNNLIESESQFEDAWAYRALFKTKELAQKYCDYKNEQSK